LEDTGKYNIGVLGGGSWGTALTLHLARKGHIVSIWVYEIDLAEEMSKTRINRIFLPGHNLPDNVIVTNDIKSVSENKDIVCCMGPSHIFRKVIEQAYPYIDKRSFLVSAAKGIENDTLLRMTEILKKIFPSSLHNRICAISGPNFAKEVANRLPAATVIASNDRSSAEYLQKVFNTDEFRTYVNNDVIGVEIAGALKNIIAIATGISDGIGFGYNARAALITRGLTEITRLGVAMGSNPLTFAGLAGMGDLVLTCSSNLSRNYRIGFDLGKGKKLEEILSKMVMVAEGIHTCKSAVMLARKYNVDVPIINTVYQILYEAKNPVIGAKELMTRELKDELYHQSKPV
jgi:glycerol-3-phosphate dehydrogenase (NAD(P)+)